MTPRARDLGIVAGLLSPVLIAIWAVPRFVTQDGPAHLYNAAIIVDSFAADPVFKPYYKVHWSPLPNWGGHLVLIGLLKLVAPWTADRIMMSATLLGFAWAMLWARGRIVGGRASFAALGLAAVAALSFSWLMGFSGFQLGACLFPITLAVWWEKRDNLRSGRLASLAGLLVVGYFCHLVSLGLTVCALGFLAVFAPAETPRGRARRLLRTGICLIPLVFLGAIYLHLSRQGGPLRPRFPAAGEFLSVSGWVGRLGWADPISVAKKDVLPFTDRTGPILAIFSPAAWLAVAGLLGLATMARRAERDPKRRVWLALAAILGLGGVFGPDAMGEGHGDYLPQRVALLGLAALVPVVDMGPKTWSRLRAPATFALAVALALQTVVVWDYALDCRRRAGPIAEAAATVRPGRRVATLLTNVETRFRVNSMLHADCWAGVVRDAVVWTNYETRYYYFPVQFRRGVIGPDSIELEKLALMSAPEHAAERLERWRDLLDVHHDQIDDLIVQGRIPALDAIIGRFFEPAEDRGEARVFRRREPL